MILAGRRRLDGEQLDALAVEHQFDFVRLGEAFDVLVAVAREADLDFVLGVEREGVAERAAAARAEGQLVEVLLLREVGRKAEGVAAGSAGRDCRRRGG